MGTTYKTEAPAASSGRKTACWALLLAIAVALIGGPALAAERSVLGRKFVVRNPEPADPTQRSISARAVERNSTDPLIGNPTLTGGAGGAVLELAALGGTVSWQTFSLDQGPSADGKFFWRALGSRGFEYVDRRGEQGQYDQQDGEMRADHRSAGRDSSSASFWRISSSSIEP